MSKWRDFLDGVERKEDLQSLVEEVQHELKLFKSRSVSEEARLHNITSVLYEIKLKITELEHKNKVLLNKVAILEEDLDL